jgi:hypothetical protein
MSASAQKCMRRCENCMSRCAPMCACKDTKRTISHKIDRTLIHGLTRSHTTDENWFLILCLNRYLTVT